MCSILTTACGRVFGSVMWVGSRLDGRESSAVRKARANAVSAMVLMVGAIAEVTVGDFVWSSGDDLGLGHWW